MYKIILTLFISTCGFLTSFAQSTFYETDKLQEIRIYFDQGNWDHLLDSLYVDGDKDRILASVEINGTRYDSIGIRYKGFSSVSVIRIKNPFNIKLDYVIEGQNHEGFDKIKLSNVIQDPSFVREALSYEIARKYMPASRANFTRVFINNVYWGLYTNVEAVNKDFIAKHFNTNDRTFVKGNPATVDLNGENSNLSDKWGTDTTSYYPYYDMESKSGWGDLYNLIDILNNNPSDIESILNVDRTLWMHAFNYGLVNFDSYIGYAQNYYMYQDENGQFNPIPWDLNMSFGSFRLTDASEFWEGFNIREAKTIDPLFHYKSVSVQPRPLMRKLFENDTWRRMFLAHLRTIMEENFADQSYRTRAQTMQSLIDASVQSDTNKFYSYADFSNNLTQTVTDFIDYPGITDLMDARTTYLEDYPGMKGAPDLDKAVLSPSIPILGRDLAVSLEVSDAQDVTLMYRFGSRGLFTAVSMLDDGTQNDGAANDGVYGIKISNVSGNLQYYFYAENDSAGRFYPERAAYEVFKTTAQIDPLDLVINEFMASNSLTVADSAGEFDDWIEIYNRSSETISLDGLFLSDKFDDLGKWAFPNETIAPDSYKIVWADEDGSQGIWHANFKLSSGGEAIILSYGDSTSIIDSLTYGSQTTDVSFARFPNGTGPFAPRFTTFSANNNFAVGISPAIETFGFSLYPNPAEDMIAVRVEDAGNYRLQLLSIEGKIVKDHQLHLTQQAHKVSVADLPAGMYTARLIKDGKAAVQKLIIQ
ncbi:MAG: CotH kinase family protein [Bacteroidia bacterium]